MKWILTIILSFTCFAAIAADEQSAAAVKPLHAPPEPSVVIVNGKKFFSLANAKHFTASGPAAMQVMHHPRSPVTIIGKRSTLEPASSSTDSASASGSKATPSDVLSVFAPDDKSVAAAPAIITPTK